MTIRDVHGHVITVEVVIQAYLERFFPMALAGHGPIFWDRPDPRAVVTWDRFKVPRSLRKVIANRRPYEVSRDQDFPAVIRACADPAHRGRPDGGWISEDIITLYAELHERGIAHSVEARDPQDGTLVGGCYGLALGGVFCGESMFHTAPDASKICVVHLVEHLQAQDFAFLDIQQQSPHMERLGAHEIRDTDYAVLFAEGIQRRCQFTPLNPSAS